MSGLLAESRCSETTSDEHACIRLHESKNISPQTRPRMGSLPSSSGYDSDDEDVRGFVRVRLVSKRIRATERLATEDTPNHIINHESDLTAPVLRPHSTQELGSTSSFGISSPQDQEEQRKGFNQKQRISNLNPLAVFLNMLPLPRVYTPDEIPKNWDDKRECMDRSYRITVEKPNSRATYSSRFYG